MPQPLRVTLLIGSALASLCMEAPPRSCRPACVRSTRTDFLRAAAAVVGASSLSLCAQGPAVASPAGERDPALLALDKMQAAGRGCTHVTCTLPQPCAMYLHRPHSVHHRPACTRGQARDQPTREVVIYKPPSIKTRSTARELKLAKHLKASGATMCARCLPPLPSRPPALPGLAGHLGWPPRLPLGWLLPPGSFCLLHTTTPLPATPRRYGAYWCSHCNSQKGTFGADAARLIRYVECAPTIPSAPPPPRQLRVAPTDTSAPGVGVGDLVPQPTPTQPPPKPTPYPRLNPERA